MTITVGMLSGWMMTVLQLTSGGYLLVGKETSSKKIGLAMIFTSLAYNSGFYSIGNEESLKISH